MKNKIISLALAMIMLISVFAFTGCKAPDAECEHTNLSTAYRHDDSKHWKICADCSTTAKFNEEEHSFTDGVCVCGYEEGKEVLTYPWTEATIKFQLTEHSNGGELSSECRRYMSGESDYVEKVDKLVAERNASCVVETGVKAEFKYLEEGNALYGWGKNTSTIVSQVTAGGTNCPDVFCNFVYDMVSASLKAAFANLNATDRGSKADGTYGLNYFEFANDPKYADKTVTDEETGVTSTYGYMYEYMRSLTLDRTKMYLVSSDYFTDMVRAFYCIPVNSKLMNTSFTVDNSTEAFKDRTGDNKFNMDDFFALVNAGKWNYETMAELCKVVAEDTESDTTQSRNGWDLRDTVGFALDANSGLAASGILYSTSIEIIHRELDLNKGDYVFEYPTTNDDLLKFCDNLKTLFSTRGVISVLGTETFGFKTPDAGETPSASDAIRAQFANNKVLFGNIVCVGALENATYQNMEDGFGVAPVPIYRTTNLDGTPCTDTYTTQVHNLGRIGAIAACTTKFAECSAYLNYQSLNSKDILERYYNDILKGKVASGAKGNEEMLDLLRKNIRSSFDKVYEDAIAFYFAANNPNATYNKWHEMIKADRYLNETLNADKYTEVRAEKQQNLEDLKAEYNSKFK